MTKQELQKYQAEQPAKYQLDSLKRDINKKLFGKAEAIVVSPTLFVSELGGPERH